ncbi:MAG TPA: ComEC/Rec2 family competence protein, partial [Pirellulales bacterium]|nr:ComEC/Rec2 family competence protein [Pirellulales bacterium]
LVAAALAAGIAADRYSSTAVVAWWLAALASWCGWLLAWRLRCTRWGTALLCFSVAGLGAAWHHQHWRLFGNDEMGRFAVEEARPVCVEAIALGSPHWVPAPPHDPLCAIPRGERTRLRVRAAAVRDGEQWRSASGIAQLWVDGRLSGVRAGDRLRVVGQLSAPAAAQNPGEFDFALHARADRQLSRLSADFPECVQVTRRGSRWSASRLLDQLRQGGDRLLWRRLDGRRAPLAAALLLGLREELDLDTTAAFAQTGTVHILSISGLHVGMLALFLFWVMRLGLVGRRLALACVALVTLGYALVIDAEPPAVRATVVVLLVCVAQWRREGWLPFNLLALAGILVLVMNPCELFRIGPQLSFLAVATLAWFGPRLVARPLTDPLDRLIAQTRPWPERLARRGGRWAWQTVALGLVVWGTSAPLVLAQFHLVSPATLVLTPLLAGPVALALLSGFVVLALGWLVPPVGGAAALLCDISLDTIQRGVEWASRAPASHFWAPAPSGWWLLGFYAALAVGAAAPGWRPPRRWCLGALFGWAALGAGVPVLAPPESPRLQCTFLSVGHGCGVVLELPDGKTLLYDAGRLGSPQAGARSVAGYLWQRGITHLDAIVLSHADVDHYNAVPELLQKFSVGVIYATPAMLYDEGPAMQKLRAAIDAANVPLRETWSGDRLRVGGDCLIEVWHPTRDGVLGSDNANSLVLDVEYQGRRILLTGDLESPGMDDLLAESPIHCDVILAPHHGSTRSDPPGFAAWSTPQWVVISGSFADRRPEVEQAYRAQRAQVLTTADCGAISVTIADAHIAVTTWRRAAPAVTRP